MKPTALALPLRSFALASFLLLLLIPLLFAGCGGGGSGSVPLTGISLGYYWVTASGLLPFTMTVGDQVQLLASGETATGEVPLSTNPTWHSTDKAVAAVDAKGLLTAVGVGSTQITATYQSFTSDPLTVTAKAPGATPTAQDYPFAAGNQWLYTGTEVSPAAATPPVTLTITTQDQVVLEGLVWWELQISYSDPKTPPGYMYLRHDDQGLREVTYVNLGSTQVPQYSYRVQEPLTAGNHWVDPARPTEHYWDLLSTTSAVTVPAGTYPNCLKVREHDVTTDGTAFYIFVWFAATVGIVRTETDTIDTTTGKLTLESHQDLLRTQFPPAAASVHRAPTPPQAVTRPRASGRTFGR